MPEDILAIRITCVQCQTAMMIPIKELTGANVALTRHCPCCHTASGFNAGTQELNNLLHFTVLLAGLQEMVKGRGITYSLEIVCAE